MSSVSSYTSLLFSTRVRTHTLYITHAVEYMHAEAGAGRAHLGDRGGGDLPLTLLLIALGDGGVGPERGEEAVHLERLGGARPRADGLLRGTVSALFSMAIARAHWRDALTFEFVTAGLAM